MPPANNRTLQRRAEEQAQQQGGGTGDPRADAGFAQANAMEQQAQAAMIQAQAFEAIARKVNPEYYAQLEAAEQASQLEAGSDEQPGGRFPKINWNKAKFWRKWGRNKPAVVDPDDRRRKSPTRIVITQALPGPVLNQLALPAPNAVVIPDATNRGYVIIALKLPRHFESRASGKYVVSRQSSGFVIGVYPGRMFASQQAASLAIRELGL